MIDAEIRAKIGSLDLVANIHVERGETLALVGPNGAGKTTLLRTLCGLSALDGGYIKIAGQLVDEPDSRTWIDPHERPVALAFQDHRLFPHLSAGENIGFAMTPHPGRDHEIDDVLHAVGLTGFGDRRVSELSGGEAQRVALARVLARDAEVLLLDEPLAAVDTATRSTLRRLLHSLDKTIVMITHDALDARLIADRVLSLDAGRVTQTGTPGELTDQPRTPWLAELFGKNLIYGQASGTEVRVDSGATITSSQAHEGEVIVTFSPTAITLHRSAPGGSARNVWDSEVRDLVADGERVRVRLGDPVPAWAVVTPAAVADLGLDVGARVIATMKATEIEVARR